jgi:hypothetical protein
MRTTRLAARQRENFLRAHVHRRSAPKLGEPAYLRFCAVFRSLEYDLSGFQAFEGDRFAGFQTEIFAHLFGYRDLPFAGEVRHEVLP